VSGFGFTHGVAGRSAREPDCPDCEPLGTLGVADEDDPRFFGGYVDERGVRHDGLIHAADCPTKPDLTRRP
jgi:hypothetical protein